MTTATDPFGNPLTLAHAASAVAVRGFRVFSCSASGTSASRMRANGPYTSRAVSSTAPP